MIEEISEGLKVLGLNREQGRLFLRVAWVLFVTFHIAWVCGWLTAFSLNAPFAAAQDFASLSHDIHQERVERIIADLNTNRSLQCHAIKVENWEAVNLYAQRIQWLTERYQEATKQTPPVHECGHE